MDLVFSDVWGPAPSSIGRYSYYVSFIDDHSKFTWLYLLRHKSEVFSIFHEFQNLIERQFGRKIQAIQTDWGGEYQALHSFFKRVGITHQVSCPHAHQQNGSAERKHRHIVEMALTLLAHASMPLKFWDEAVSTAVYLINRLPSKVLVDESPFEKLFNQKPNYNFLPTFGCAVWPHLRPYNSQKLAFRSKQCVFIVYSSLHKGYKFLDPKDGRVYISRDVVFDEHVFPFASLHPNAGARLRKEIELLPDLFPSPSTSLGNVNLLHQHMPSPASTNRSSSCLDVAENAEKIPNSNGEETRRLATIVPGHFMCSPAGGSAHLEADSPALVPSGAVGASSSAAAPTDPLSPDRCRDLTAGSGFSTPSSAPHVPPQPYVAPQPDPTGGTTAPTEILSSGSIAVAAPAIAPAAPTPQHPSTRLSQGISKPKSRTDGTVRWCMHAKVPIGEPTMVDEALGHKHWVTAMDA
jgi:hypothetical protein